MFADDQAVCLTLPLDLQRILEHQKYLGKQALEGLQAERDAALQENQRLGSQVAAFMVCDVSPYRNMRA